MKAILVSLLLFAYSVCFAAQGRLQVSVTPVPPNLQASIAFKEPSGNNMLDAEETAVITITIKNSGQGDAYDVKADVAADKSTGINYSRSMDFGTIPAGKTVSKTLDISSDDTIKNDKYTFRIKITELNGFAPPSTGIAFNSKAFQAPKLVLVGIKQIGSKGDDNSVEPMENVEITARIQNTGQGDAQNVNAVIKTGANVFITGNDTAKIGSLKPGEYKDVKFMVFPNSNISDGSKLPVSIEINEQRGRYGLNSPVAMIMKNIDSGGIISVAGNYEADKPNIIETASGFVSDIDSNVPQAKEKAGKYDVAVVIGNSRYSKVPNVDYAVADARSMKKYLMETFGFKEGNIIYEENASYTKFNEIFGTGDFNGKLSNYIREGVSNVFIFYAGHGAPDLKTSEAYLVPVDADPLYLTAGGYRLQAFYDRLAKLQAKKITLVMDACFSGSTGESSGKMLFKNISPAMVKVKEEYRKPANVTVISSSSMKEVSTWYPEKQHGMFSYWFLKGLQGEADNNRDKKITLGEIKEYLKDNVTYEARKRGIQQNPVIDGNESDVLLVLK